MSFAAAKPRYSDFNTSFSPHPVSGDLASITDIEAIKRSVRSLILTDKYERLLDPKIGSNVRAMLFEPMDGATAVAIQSYIQETIKNYEPRANLMQVQVVPDFDHNSYIINIIFGVSFSEQITQIKFFMERIR
jgi:phage baseplate assembly protein W